MISVEELVVAIVRALDAVGVRVAGGYLYILLYSNFHIFS